MNEPIGFVSLRSAAKYPAKAQPRRPLLNVDPIAYDPDGVPHGVRLALADDAGVVWVDIGRADAERLVARIRERLGPKPPLVERMAAYATRPEDVARVEQHQKIVEVLRHELSCVGMQGENDRVADRILDALKQAPTVRDVVAQETPPDILALVDRVTRARTEVIDCGQRVVADAYQKEEGTYRVPAEDILRLRDALVAWRAVL